jgi:SRSO17 transposase
MKHAKYVTRPETCPGNSQGGYVLNLCEPEIFHAVTVKNTKRIITTRENLFLHLIKMVVCCPAFKTNMTKIIFLFGQIFLLFISFLKTKTELIQSSKYNRQYWHKVDQNAKSQQGICTLHVENMRSFTTIRGTIRIYNKY